ncbi:hypothetical protein AVEN_28640-1 [Araneus ventricosus]|uniref:Retrovirus-related Pol polyprotein from transposon TNT 1-94 n=1 Tax=Araneus ventricosus TaxID=182803 RepID=A0A4Y2FGF5_ARAVE|nr:hypothetical protein AVEN_28640-1 [Araneus ventricosus]
MHSAKRAEAGKELSNGERYVGEAREHLPFKRPCEKTYLLKSLLHLKMETGSDVCDHIRKFFDIIDKLQDLDIVIDEDLTSVMLLYSLPANFETFRVAIESRGELPKLVT